MERILLWLLAAGALIGGIDCLLGNRLGLGEHLIWRVSVLGPTALSMAGILLSFSSLSGYFPDALPLWQRIGFDPGMLGGFIPIDMGGYQAAVDLASDPTIGLYAGILVSATAGCTLAFTIPMGMGLLSGGHERFFPRDIDRSHSPCPRRRYWRSCRRGCDFSLS